MSTSTPQARRVLWSTALAAFALTASGCGDISTDGAKPAANSAPEAAIESAPLEGRPDIAEFCGEKEITVALADGFGGNAWRKIVKRQFEKEAAKCPNIKKTIYTNANSDPQKYASDINGLVAQGVDAIITFDDFGPAALPTLKKATKAGVVVVPYIANPGGTPGEDYSVFVAEDTDQVGKEWAGWAQSVLKDKGTVAMLGGTPGNPLSTAFLDGYKKNAPSSITLAQDDPLNTDWTVAGMQQAATGMLTRYPDTGLILTDFGAGIQSLARAYDAAGQGLVPVAATASTNEVGCAWDQLKKNHPSFELFSVEGTTNVSVVALRKAVAAAQGLKNTEASMVQLPVFIDTLNGKMPVCDPSLPADADMAADLTPAEMREIFSN
ncbi:substrate-binding domain-containing protein [Arthrobacter sp. StoSoilB20]|uniref:substrate-binding domain-containing protein n=1 Tax=Arthrobacter sp. StoSoilB20 TaxID=2830995 RepID=UPI001CC55B99|nr:substrate-binding domain-containing protein [Arthrobacter sp. StoSoilB20]BCW58577.1 sugar ABC transporter substrate-binding protein [Arthrobacter sp. StoSoilB20]